jgi:hypothetical protein
MMIKAPSRKNVSLIMGMKSFNARQRELMRLIFMSLFFFSLGCQSLALPTGKRSNCEKTEIQIGPQDFRVEVTRYGTTSNSNHAIIIRPPTGGATVLDRSFAKKFCRAGFDVYILNHWTGDNEKAIDLDLHHRLYTRAHKAATLLIETLPQGFIGMLGTSVGATFAAVEANLHERVDAIFTIVGGAPIPGVVVHSDQKAMRELKEKRMEKFHFKTDTEYLEALNAAFPLDPLKTSPVYKQKQFGMIISSTDTTVPAAYQKKLADLWKPQVVYIFSTNHFYSIIRAWWSYQNEIIQFFINSASREFVSK